MRRAHHHPFDDRLSANYDLVFSHTTTLTIGQKTLVAECRFYFRINKLTILGMNRQLADATGRPGNQYWVVDKLSFGFTAVPAIESLDAAGSVYKFLLSCEERVATGAYLKPNLRLC
jgi:hypothetical protein